MKTLLLLGLVACAWSQSTPAPTATLSPTSPCFSYQVNLTASGQCDRQSTLCTSGCPSTSAYNACACKCVVTWAFCYFSLYSAVGGSSCFCQSVGVPYQFPVTTSFGLLCSSQNATCGSCTMCNAGATASPSTPQTKPSYAARVQVAASAIIGLILFNLS